MDPIQIKQYLMERKLATLQDIAIHFRMETDTVTPMLDLWIRKGKVKKHDDNLGCQKGCCKCDPATIETYEWIDYRQIMATDKKLSAKLGWAPGESDSSRLK